MRRHIWIVCTVVGLFAWLGLGPGFVFAQGDVIYPVDLVTFKPMIPNAQVTLTIFDQTGNPIHGWLPVPGQQVTVKVIGAQLTSVTSVQLVFDSSKAKDPTNPSSPSLTTSAYPGVCTNYGDDLGPDYTLAVGDLNTFKLTAQDSGGMAVVLANTDKGYFTFVIPQDTNFNGIPDIYENQYGGNLDRNADIDTGPDPSSPPASPVGDGIANIDEYRGFKIGGLYVRGDPKKKDLFVHLEDTPQCTATAWTFTGQSGTVPVTLATFFATPLGLDSPLYMNVNTLAPAVLVHRINNDEWVNNFSSYDKDQWVILIDNSAESATTDRWINKNAIYPLGDSDSLGRKFVKGVRIIQCLDRKALSPLGRSAKSPPDLFDKDNGNAVLFVHRIVQSMLNAIKLGGNRSIKYFTYVGSAWKEQSTIPRTWTSTDPSVADTNVQSIMKIAFAWYLAHEALEHSYDVTAATEGTYGYHHADGSGTNVDAKIINTVDSKAAPAGFNNFNIPKYHGISDDRQMRVLSSQQLSQ